MGVDCTLNAVLVNMSLRGVMRAEEESFPPGSFEDKCIGGGFLNVQLRDKKSRAGPGADGVISLVKHSGWL